MMSLFSVLLLLKILSLAVLFVCFWRVQPHLGGAPCARGMAYDTCAGFQGMRLVQVSRT